MIGLARITLRYQTTPKDDDELRLALIRLAKQYGRYGYRKIAQLLRMEGWTVNQRLWREEGLQLPQRHKRRKRLYHKDSSVIRLRPKHPNHIWSVDFVHDKLSSGRRYKMLTVLNEYTRQALYVAVATKMGHAEVLDALYPLFLKHGKARIPSIRQRTRVHRRRLPGLAQEGRHQAHPDLSRKSLGEWIQRTLQRNALARSAQCRVVLKPQAGAGRHQQVAQTVQSRPSASGAQHETAGAGNRTTGGHIGWGLYTRLCYLRIAYRWEFRTKPSKPQITKCALAVDYVQWWLSHSIWALHTRFII